MKIHSSPAKSHKLSRITSSQPCKHAASITESPSQDKLLLIRQFFARLTGPLPSKCTLTFAHSFAELSRNFRENTPIRRPSHQQGAHQRKSKHQGPWCLALAKSRFWKLGCCIWNLCLETSESNVKQYQQQVQGGASRPWYLAHVRKLGCYLWSGAILLPDPGRQEVVALNIQLSQNFREIFFLSRTRKNNFREGFQHNMHGFRN